MAFHETERRRQGGLRRWRTVSLYGQADREIEAYATSLSVQIGLMWKSYLTNLGFKLVSGITVNFGHFAATALVVLHGLQTSSTIGSVVAFSGYWNLLQDPLLFFTKVSGRVIKDLYAADRLRRVLEIKPTMTYGTEHLRLTGGRVEFKNVTVRFACGGGETFRELNLALTTRLYDPTEGVVTIDGQDIRKLKKAELPKHIAVMAQSPHLFNNTIMYNIRYGRPDATESEVHDAAKKVGIHARIMSLPEQYDTVVGEGGGFFSGGETQRLALARVLIQRADILIFDEATSALDADTEAHIKESINTLCAGHRDLRPGMLPHYTDSSACAAAPCGKMVTLGTVDGSKKLRSLLSSSAQHLASDQLSRSEGTKYQHCVSFVHGASHWSKLMKDYAPNLWVMFANSGMMVGTQYFQGEDKPFYQNGLRIMIVMASVGIFGTLMQLIVYIVHNRRVAQGKTQSRDGSPHFLHIP
ncbi:hypothetical protein MAP00_003656 [Monascus purpureus]|nr:hypothetical protein MAP00_003656 [Monascus purpureus]